MTEHHSKPWKDLQFIKQIVIKPEDSKNPMWVEFKDEVEYDDLYDSCLRPVVVSRDRAIKLGANTMYSVEMDYPENFKKLVQAVGDAHEAYRLYKALDAKVWDNWADYAEGDIW